jgi:hypothetical protein
MPTINIPKPAGAGTPIPEPTDPSTAFIRLEDNEVYFHNGSAWVGLNGARRVCSLASGVQLHDAVVVVDGEARKASANVDKYCSGVVSWITPAGLGVVASAGKVPISTTEGLKYFLGSDGELTATPNPDTQHIVLIGTGEGDSLLLTLGVSSEAPI